jgi:hypothetical protein
LVCCFNYQVLLAAICSAPFLLILVNFAKEHKDMITHCRLLMSNNLMSIDSTFDKLITSLRTAVDNEGVLDKEAISYSDILDVFRVALKFYRFE